MCPRRLPRWRVVCWVSLQSVPQEVLCRWLTVCWASYSTNSWSWPETVWINLRVAWSPPGTSWSCRRNWRSCCMRWVSQTPPDKLKIMGLSPPKKSVCLAFILVNYSIQGLPQSREKNTSPSTVFALWDTECYSCTENIGLKLLVWLALVLCQFQIIAGNAVVILYYHMDVGNGQVFDYIMIYYITSHSNSLAPANFPLCRIHCFFSSLRARMTFFSFWLRKLYWRITLILTLYTV